jgi:hypothetical protein
MDSITHYDTFKTPALSIGDIHKQAPAAFASTPFSTTSPNYRFISTAQIVSTLLDAGFEAVAAKQANSRGERSNYARHMLRFRSLSLPKKFNDVVPQIVLINSHDGTSAYQLRAGLYRTLCMNGLLARVGDFGVIHIAHRANVIANIVEAALQIARGFSAINDVIDLMHDAVLTEPQRLRFAEQAFDIRFHRMAVKPAFDPRRLLEARREVDKGNDLWRVFNAVQENCLRGGIAYTRPQGRSASTRGIRAIREDVRINTALWGAAMTSLASL